MDEWKENKGTLSLSKSESGSMRMKSYDEKHALQLWGLYVC
jgi:hypothetical protein